MTFLDITFPQEITYESFGGPSFSTQISYNSSHEEIRKSLINIPLYKYNISYGLNNYRNIQYIIDFFTITRGSYHSFRLQDWLDNQLYNQLIGTGDNSQTIFSIYKTITIRDRNSINQHIVNIPIKHIKKSTLTITTQNTDTYNISNIYDGSIELKLNNSNNTELTFAEPPLNNEKITVTFDQAEISKNQDFQANGRQRKFIITENVVDNPSLIIKRNDQIIHTNKASIDINTGIITFVTAPNTKENIKVSCNFYKEVRFDNDFLPIYRNDNNGYFCKDIILKEVR